MANVAKGENFVSDPSVTGTRLNDHIDNATISGIAQADLVASSGLLVRSASAPSDTDAGWWDTGNLVLRIHDGTSWTPVGNGALLTNKSGGTVVAGDLVVADSTTDSAFTTSTTQADGGVLGVAAESIAADATGVILFVGIQNVLVSGTVNRGEFLRHSTTAKKADSTTTKDSGSFGIALETGTDTTIKSLITGTVVSLSGGGNEAITGLWDFSGGLKLTNSSAPTTGADEVGVYSKDISSRAWPHFREESDGNEVALGRILQVVNTQDGAVATGATTTPNDNTIPQITEGNEVMTRTITPTNSSSQLKIDVVCNAVESTNTGAALCVALHQDAVPGALAAVNVDQPALNVQAGPICFSHFMTAGTTSEITFRVRVGNDTGPITFNGVNSLGKLGGVMASSITVTEILA